MREMSYVQRMEQCLLKDMRKAVWRPFMRAIRDYRLLAPGDRIAVCVSGGKDSMLLAKLMQMLLRHSETPFEAVFLAMDPGYSPENRRRVEENARRLELPCTVFESDVFEVANAQDEHPCFLCARMRRGCLYGKARELGCNKIALGHHYDDVIETTVMAMFYGGQLQAMSPRLKAKNFPGMELIRPMYLIREDDIIDWAQKNSLVFLRCACHFTETCSELRPDGSSMSKRLETKQLIRRLHETNPDIEANLFKTAQNVNLDRVIAYKKNMVRHSFLDEYEA